MIGKRDCKYGPHIYAPVWKWDEELVIHEMFDSKADALNSLFGHIYFKYSVPNSEGVTVDTWVDVGIGSANIEADWVQEFDERLVAFPYYPCSDEGNTISVRRLKDALAVVLDKWTWKYKKLVETIGLSYDPIENYNMVESGTDTDTPTGTTTKNHEVDAMKVGMIRLTGMVDGNTTISQDETTGNYSIENLGINKQATKLTKADAVSDIQAAKKAKRTNDEISIDNGTQPENKFFTTTMDDATTGRLESYNQTLGDTAQATYNNITEAIPAMAEIQSGNPHFASYTDTESFTSRVDTKVHNFSRSGNIGVTTSQQMLTQQREVVKFSIINEFFKDLNAEILLSVWD